MTGGSPKPPRSCKAVRESGTPPVNPSNPYSRPGRKARSPLKEAGRHGEASPLVSTYRRIGWMCTCGRAARPLPSRATAKAWKNSSSGWARSRRRWWPWKRPAASRRWSLRLWLGPSFPVVVVNPAQIRAVRQGARTASKDRSDRRYRHRSLCRGHQARATSFAGRGHTAFGRPGRTATADHRDDRSRTLT